MDDLKKRISSLPPEKRTQLEQRIAEQLRGEKKSVSSIPKRTGNGPFPLSFSQERLWFLHQLHPDLAAYNEASAFRLIGELNIEALQTSLDAFIQRHEILRTVYKLEHDIPVQIVNPVVNIALPQIDLAHLPKREHEQTLHQRIQAEIYRPFDLSSDLMLRSCLFRLNDREYLLLLVKHHIAWDGWSIRIFERELLVGYQATIGSSSINLPDLAIQYADYACWQREQYSHQRLQPQVAFWRQHLANLKPLNLPKDHLRPSQTRFRGAVVRFPFSNELSDSLQRLGRQYGATLFMVLLAGFDVLLMRFAGQEDIAIGVPIAGRNYLELEPLVGFFVNTLVMRADLSGNPSFSELLGRVKKTAISAYENQALPFEALVEELQPERRLDRNPLIQVTFQLFNVHPIDLPEIPDLQWEDVPLESEAAQFDMQVMLTVDGGVIQGSWRYNTDLFDQDTIQRLIRCYTTILESAVGNPEIPICDSALLTVEEIESLARRWRADITPPVPRTDIYSLFEAQALRTPDSVAVIYEEERMTYQELEYEASQLADYLGALGAGLNSPIGLLMDRRLEMILGLLGILKTGAVLVPLDPHAPRDRIEFIINDCGIKLLLTTSELEERFKDLPIKKVVIDRLELLEHRTTHRPESEINPDSLAYILYTSGSTGQPKGVMVEHHQIISYTFDIVNRLGLKPGGNFAMLQPLTVDSCLTMIFPALLWGGTIHLISREQALDAAGLCELFKRQPADYLKIAPSHLNALLAEKQDPELLPRQTLIIGGETLHWSLIDQIADLHPNCAVWNHYGPTETTVGVLAYPIRLNQSGEPSKPNLRERSATVPVGVPLDHTNAYVLDPAGNPLPIGFAGELYIGGDQVSRGYLNQPSQTGGAFLPDPWVKRNSSRMYRTGDFVRQHPGEVIEFLGRMDDQVKQRGFRIELGEIEAALKRFPGIADAAVKHIQDDKGGFTIAAYTIKLPDQDISQSELLRFLRLQLPEQMLPSSITLLDELPLMPHGKIDRQALPSPKLATRLQPDKPPQTITERKLAKIWSQVLNLPSISRQDNFFEQGGHSLLAIRLIARVDEAFEIRLPLGVLFEFPSLAGMAKAIDVLLQGSIR